MGIAMIGNDIGNLLARVEACCKDGDVYVVLVAGSNPPAVSHVAPASPSRSTFQMCWFQIT